MAGLVLDVVDPESLDGLVPWVTVKNEHRIPQHPLGISFLAAPLAGVFGWRSCYVLGFVIWVAGAFLFARLLERERLPAVYTVLYLLFPPLLLYSRFYMTDVPSAVLCLAALYALRIPEPEGDPVARGFSDRRRAVLGMSALGFAFLYIPILLLVIYSFNESKLVTVWGGWSTKWYGELLQNESLLNAAWVTLRVAIVSSTLATILGTMAAITLVSRGTTREAT